MEKRTDNLNVDSRKRARNDATFILVGAFIAWLIIEDLELFEKLNEYTRTHEEYEIDEMIIAFMLMGIGTIIYSIRRWFDLKREVKARAELEINLARSERLAAIGILVNGLAHQYHNINTSIITIAEILLGEEYNSSNEDTKSGLDTIRERALYGSKIAQNLSLFANPNTTQKVPEDIPALINRVADSFRPVFEHEDIYLEVNCASTNPVMVNSADFLQAIYNLLLNAQHSLLGRTDKKIIIDCREEKGRIWTSIADNGCGIPDEDRHRIFSPFYSTKGEHSKGVTPQSAVRGVGLGLSVAHSIIQELGGELTVESRENSGSTFTFSLPVYTEQE